jgi:hypothetical protein
MRLTQPKFLKTYRYLRKLKKFDVMPLLHEMGSLGVSSLELMTPRDTGETASAWGYLIKKKGDSYKLVWTNRAMGGQTPITLLLQYGHGSKSGYYISGRDYINPALRPIYDTFLKRLGQEVAA